MSEHVVYVTDLFNGEGNLKRKANLSEAFLRPVYQYTPQEIRNTQRESWVDEPDLFDTGIN